MSYKKHDANFKLEILHALWSGESYSQLSKKHAIPRATIYRWEQLANQAIIKAFHCQSPGKKTVSIKEENKKLKEQLRILYHNMHSKAQSEPPEPNPPLICSKCGSSHLKKNGTIITKTDGLRQRYVCVACSFSIYVTLKKTPLADN